MINRNYSVRRNKVTNEITIYGTVINFFGMIMYIKVGKIFFDKNINEYLFRPSWRMFGFSNKLVMVLQKEFKKLEK